MRTAATLCRGIPDEIGAADYAVLDRRVVVPDHRRVLVAAAGLTATVALRTPVPVPGV